MKKIICYICLLLEIAVLLSSCEKAPFVTMNGPRNYNFPHDGGTQSFTFSCNKDWNVSSSESWIRVSPSSGKAADGEITVTITCSPNTTYDPRSATITVKVAELMETISVSQDTGLGLVVSPTSFDLTNAAQTIEIEIQKNVNYSVEIDDACKEWIKRGGTKALSTDKVSFNISENASYDNREGKIVFKQADGSLTQTVTVRQGQTNGLFITTSEYSLSNEEHSLSIEVKANVEFEVISQADWIKFVETKALAPSTITLKVEANESYDNRTGTVLVKQTNGDLKGTVTITQKQTDFLSVSPTSLDLSNAEQSIDIEVKDNVSYSVVIPDDAKSWISIISNTQTKALAEDKIVLAIAQNATYDNREASVTIKQVDGALSETVSIKQAYKEGLFIEKTQYEITNEAQSLDIEVKSNVEYEVSSDAEWISVVGTKALNSSTISLSILVNNNNESRTSIISIRQVNGSLIETVTIKQLGIVYSAEAVDMGLSVKWSRYNLGASTPEGRGVLFAWGEVETKDSFSWNNYKWCVDGNPKELTKYCSNAQCGYEGFTDYKYILDLEDDAAHVILGSTWRMPTGSEFSELFDKTKCEWKFDNTLGYTITSKSTGNSIILPLCVQFTAEDTGMYWTNGRIGVTDSSWQAYSAYAFGFGALYNTTAGRHMYDRFNGFAIRPVSD